MSGASFETTLELWALSLRDVKARIRPLFTQARVAASAGLCLDGLLGPERHKTGWMRAEAAADQEHGNALVSRYHCNSCHGADLAGHDNIPRIAGQREDYLLKSLTDYKSGARPGYSPAMSEASKEIKPEDIPVLARFVASLK